MDVVIPGSAGGGMLMGMRGAACSRWLSESDISISSVSVMPPGRSAFVASKSSCADW